MSFVPAISNRDALALFAVVAVGVLGLFMRRGSTVPPAAGIAGPPPPPDAEGPDAAADVEEEVDGDADIVAVTSDGWSFMPLDDRDRVRLVPPLTPHEMEQVVPRSPSEQLGRGDLIGARLKRGSPDHDPWRIEALGRDGEYRAWRFETPEAARAALALLSGRIVRGPRDEEGIEVTMGDRDYSEARRREEEIETEMAAMSDIEEQKDDPLRRAIE